MRAIPATHMPSPFRKLTSEGTVARTKPSPPASHAQPARARRFGAVGAASIWRYETSDRPMSWSHPRIHRTFLESAPEVSDTGDLPIIYRRSVPRSYVKEARKRVGPKRQRIRPIIERLAVEHADATIALTFSSPLELLVSVMLSAQTTDVNVNRVTATLFQKYRAPEDYLAVPLEELERDIFATGFYRQKAKSLRGMMKMLIEEFDGVVPNTLEE